MVTAPAFNPVLLDVPDQIETGRLLVRAPRPGDGAVINASVLETLDDLRRYPASMIWAMEDQPIDKTEEYARQGAANWIIRADFPLIAFRRDTGEHVGNVDCTDSIGRRVSSRSAGGVESAFRDRGSSLRLLGPRPSSRSSISARVASGVGPTLRTSGAGAWPRGWDTSSREPSRASAVILTALAGRCGSMQRHDERVRF